MQFVIELYKLACGTAERKVVCRGLDVQGIGGWAVRVLRNTYCPRTVLCVYAQHLSASWTGLALLSCGHGRYRRRRRGILDVYGRIKLQKGECVDVLSLRSRVAPPPCG